MQIVVIAVSDEVRDDLFQHQVKLAPVPFAQVVVLNECVDGALEGGQLLHTVAQADRDHGDVP